MIEKRRPPEAFLGVTREVSRRILRSLNASGYLVPDDISLVSIENIEMPEYANPPLTTVDVDTWEMGRMAVQVLMRRTTGFETLPPATPLLPTTLIIRESCG